MPEIIPTISTQSAPGAAPASEAPVPTANAPAPKNAKPLRDDEAAAESFADAYEALGLEASETVPEAKVAEPEIAEVAAPILGPDLANLPLRPEDVEDVDTPESNRMKPTIDTENRSVQLAKASEPPAQTAQQTQKNTPARSALVPQDAEVLPVTQTEGGEPDIPARRQVETVGLKGAAPQPAAPNAVRSQPSQTVVQPATPAAPTIQGDAEALAPGGEAVANLPEPEADAPIPERIALRDPPPPLQRAPQLPATANPMPQVQIAEAGNQTLEPLDEHPVLAAQSSNPTTFAPSTAPGAAPAQIAQHAAGQIVAALPRDQGVIVTDAGAEIALDPPELGRVRMVVTEIAGGLALTVTAERQETLDLFRRNAQMLAEEFAREGLADTSFAFEGEGDAQAGGTGNKNDSAATRSTADTQDLIESITPKIAQNGGLDLRL